MTPVQFSSVAQSCPTLWPHESQHARPPCPSPTPGVYSNSWPMSRWCHPAISSSVTPFSSCPQPLPPSGSFPMSQLFAWLAASIWQANVEQTMVQTRWKKCSKFSWKSSRKESDMKCEVQINPTNIPRAGAHAHPAWSLSFLMTAHTGLLYFNKIISYKCHPQLSLAQQKIVTWLISNVCMGKETMSCTTPAPIFWPCLSGLQILSQWILTATLWSR